MAYGIVWVTLTHSQAELRHGITPQWSQTVGLCNKRDPDALHQASQLPATLSEPITPVKCWQPLKADSSIKQAGNCSLKVLVACVCSQRHINLARALP